MRNASAHFGLVVIMLCAAVSLFSCAEEINPVDSIDEQTTIKEDVADDSEVGWIKVDYGSDTIYTGIDSLIRTPGSSFGRMHWTNNKKLETTITIIDKNLDTVFIKSYQTGYITIQFSELPSGVHHMIFSDINGPIKDEKILIR